MTLGFEAAIAIDPTAPVTSLSKIGRQVRPASVVFHTPPFAVPAKNVFGCDGTPTATVVRPPRNGPSGRHPISPNIETSTTDWRAESVVGPPPPKKTTAVTNRMPARVHKR